MKKTFGFLQKNLFYFIILIVGIAYILTGVSEITESGSSVLSILTSSALAMILGWLISSLMGQQAIKDGYNDLDFIKAQNEQATAIEAVNDHIDKLDTYCDRENEASMIRKRTRILKKVGIKYSQFESGLYGSLAMTKKRKKAIKSASEIGFGYLTSDWLLADIDEEEEKNAKRTSVNKYQTKQNISNLLTKVVTGILSGSFILEPFVKADWNIIIWRFFFFAVWLFFGYVRYITDFNFMTRDYRKSVINKTNYLIKFNASLKQHPEWYLEKNTETNSIPEEITEKKDEVPDEHIQPVLSKEQ